MKQTYEEALDAHIISAARVVERAREHMEERAALQATLRDVEHVHGISADPSLPIRARVRNVVYALDAVALALESIERRWSIHPIRPIALAKRVEAVANALVRKGSAVAKSEVDLDTLGADLEYHEGRAGIETVPGRPFAERLDRILDARADRHEKDLEAIRNREDAIDKALADRENFFGLPRADVAFDERLARLIEHVRALNMPLGINDESPPVVPGVPPAPHAPISDTDFPAEPGDVPF